MAELSVAGVLARTATHEANAWLLSIAAGTLAAFGALLLSGRAGPERARSEYGLFASWPAGARWPEYATLGAVLAAGIGGAAVGAALLPIVLRLPAAVAARDVAVLFVGDRMAIGALVGFGVAGGLAARGVRIDPMRALDRLAPSMGALVVLGRIGCFLEGCDFGAVTGVAWGVTYPAGSHAFEHQVARGLVRANDAAALPVHPAQLYEALAGLAMIAAALWMLRRADGRSVRSGEAARDGLGASPRPLRIVQASRDGLGASSQPIRDPPGAAFRTSIAVYAIARFLIELLRGDVRASLGPLSMPQWLCVALLGWAAGGLLSNGPETAPDAGREATRVRPGERRTAGG